MSTRKSRNRRWLNENFREIALGDIENVSMKLHNLACKIYGLNYVKSQRTLRAALPRSPK